MQRFRERRRDGLYEYADVAPMYSPLLANLPVYGLHDVAGNGETQPLAAAGLRQNERVDPDDVAIRINQRPSAVAGIDGCVGLHVDHGVVWLDLAGGGAPAPPAIG